MVARVWYLFQTTFHRNFSAKNTKISPIFNFDRRNNGWICHTLCVKYYVITFFTVILSLGAGYSGTYELGLVYSLFDGQYLFFNTLCHGFKLDASAEIEGWFGVWRNAEVIRGESYSYGGGTVYILGQ